MILVTGGAGYIGSHTVKLLLAQGKEVLVFDNLLTGHHKAVVNRAQFELGDLRDAPRILRVFQNHDIEAVIHFAASADVADSMKFPLTYYDNNVTSGINLLNAMISTGCQKIVFSSSAAVYGQPKDVPIHETSRKIPCNPYGDSKLAFERILAWAHQAHGISSVSFRYFNAAGADPEGELGEDHRPEHHLIPRAIKAVMNHRKLQVFGDDWDTRDGTCVRDYIHVMDLARAHVKAIDFLETQPNAHAFNLGTGFGYSVSEVIQTVSAVAGESVPYEIVERRPGDPPSLVASIDLARMVLGFEPLYQDLLTIVSDAFRWRLLHPKGYES